MPEEDNHSKPPWFSPQLALQLGTILVSMAIGWGLMRSDIRSLSEEVSRLSRAIEALPAPEVLALRFGQLETQVADLKQSVRGLEAWNKDTREKLIRKRIID